MARELHTMVEISASPDQVWQVLTDFDAWPDWNVADPGFVGEMHEGAEVELTSTSPSGKRSQVRISGCEAPGGGSRRGATCCIGPSNKPLEQTARRAAI